MGKNKMWGILLDEEGDPRKLEFEIMKWDSDKFTKKGMAWDSDFVLSGTSANDRLERLVLVKRVTVMIATASEKSSTHKVLGKAMKFGSTGPASKKGVLDRFQLNVIDHDGLRRSVDFMTPRVRLNQPGATGKGKNKEHFLAFTFISETKPLRDRGEIIN